MFILGSRFEVVVLPLGHYEKNASISGALPVGLANTSSDRADWRRGLTKTQVCMLYEPYEFLFCGIRPIWLYALLRNVHRNERCPASNTVSSILYTSMLKGFNYISKDYL